jgi:hypothetical protein
MALVNETIYKQTIQTTASINYEQQVKKHVDAVQSIFLPRYFPLNFIIDMDAFYGNGNGAPNSDQAYVISLLQEALCNFGTVKALPKMIVALTGSGALQAENNTKKPLYEWQKLELENECSEAAWDAIERIFVFLESKIGEPITDKWINTPERANYYSTIITTAIDFNKVYPIGCSRRTFEALKPSMRDVENLIIRPLMDASVYAAYIDEISTGGTESSNALKPYLVNAIANLTIGNAIYKLDFKFDEDGARVVTTSAGGGSDKRKIKNLAGRDDKIDVANQCNQLGQQYLNDLKKYLIDNSIISDNTVTIDNSTGASFVL